ncbi:uroporphyrinogen-III C-methyltransferase [Alteromonas sp. ASW11-130]|uniref:uroporphyrinogen-III C-methyltransferase n=1 Tax=Alteromonas sp. ASW11-130 TaxID=3015775 RepID=UPI002241FF20|nr:uroporphyrinogen-III C-methyltransferase [Alteromonas sp. ASW11-130]MCW8091113.1 uroporphyrinogen-III C-methyltransferase [Alteromonas sp. ASW11-130]
MADNKDNNKESSTMPAIEGQVTGKRETTSSIPPKQESEKKTTSKPRSHALLWLMILICLLGVAGLGGAGYWFIYNKQDNNQTLVTAHEKLVKTQEAQQDRLAKLNQDNAALQQQLSQLEQSRQALGKAVNELTATSRTMQRQTESALTQLQNLEGKRPSDWLIAEADYLVRMAGRKVWLERDIRTAIMLLVNADKRLKSLSDPSVLPVRALIAEDIQTLQQVNPVSRTSVALAISGLLPQVDKLPLDTFERPLDPTQEKVSDSVDDWKANIKRVWRSLVDDFVSVKRTDKPIEPMMSEQQQWLNREQLKLALMQAQSAAMGSEHTLYQQSLNNAKTLLEQKFDKDDSKVVGMLSGIENLQITDVSKELPNKLAAQAPLETLLEQRVKNVFGKGDSAI